jgi:phosphatidate cytidylyltransferase
VSDKAPARSDLPTRFAAAIVMIAVAIVATYFGGWWFRALAAAAAAVMLIEWTDMHRVARRWAYVGAALLVAALLAGAESLYPAGGADWIVDEATGDILAYFDAETLAPNWTAFGGLAGLGLVTALLSRRPALGGGIVYVGIPAFAMISLSWVWAVLVFWVFIVTWATVPALANYLRAGVSPVWEKAAGTR